MKKSKNVISQGDGFPGSIDNFLSNPYFKKLQSFGLIDEIAVRNFIIKNEYRDLRNKLSLGNAVDQLSQKYLLSESAINNILFRKRNRKPISFPNSKHSFSDETSL